MEVETETVTSPSLGARAYEYARKIAKEAHDHFRGDPAQSALAVTALSEALSLSLAALAYSEAPGNADGALESFFRHYVIAGRHLAETGPIHLQTLQPKKEAA